MRKFGYGAGFVIVALAAWAGAARAQETGGAARAGVAATEAPRAADGASVDTLAIYDLRQLTTRPEMVNRSEVGQAMSRNYPDAMRDEGIPGHLTIEVVVARDGRVEATRLVRTSGPGWVEAANAVARTMRFKPGEVSGVPVRVRMELPLDFEVQGRSRPRRW